MARAFEDQAVELEAVNATVAALQASLSAAAKQVTDLRSQLDGSLRDADVARTSKNQAEARTAEVERRASDLRLEVPLTA